MVRIRGTIGDWPVDLTVELDESDWIKLGAQLQVSEVPISQPPAKPANQDDAVWEATKDLLRTPPFTGVNGSEFGQRLECSHHFGVPGA